VQGGSNKELGDFDETIKRVLKIPKPEKMNK